MNLLHAPCGTEFVEHRPTGNPAATQTLGCPVPPQIESGTACITPEDELPRGGTAGLSLRHTVSHIGNFICASKSGGDADCSRRDGCRDERCLHCRHPFG